jgi:ubiquinone/menaquinone biosynthesis C-methylase UbiE
MEVDEKLEKYVIPPYRKFRTFYHSQKYFKHAKQYFYDIVAEHKPESILDVGCGHGLDSKPIMSLGVRYVGIDPIERNLKLARKDNPDGDFMHGYMQEIPFPDNSFEWVFTSTVWDILPTVEDLRIGLNEMMRVAQKRVYSLEAGKHPSRISERYMMVPMHMGLTIKRVNYNPEKEKADTLWCIDLEGIK